MNNIFYAKTTIRILIFVALLLTNSVAQKSEQYKLLITSDPHTTFQLHQYNPLLYMLRQRHENNTDSLIRFFRTVPERTGADAVVITGDMIDFYAGDISADNTVKMANQIEQFAAISKFCPVPLYLIIGNHDIVSYWVNPVDSSKIETEIYVEKAKAAWIKNLECFKEGTYYEKKVTVGGVVFHLFFLDNGYSLHDRRRILDKTQLDWLESRINKAGDEPALLFMHRYYSIGDINNDGIFFKKNSPVEWPSEEDCTEGLLKIINDHANIKALFVGHAHNNVWEPIQFPAGQTVYQIMSSTVYKNRNNWRIVTLTENKLIITHTGSTDKEIVIEIH